MNIMTQTPNLKPGLLTTEFWASIATSIAGILILLGYIQPTEGDQLVQAVVSVVGGLLTLGTMIAYIYGRIKLKQSQIENSSQITQLLETATQAKPTGNSQVFVK